MLLKWAVHFLVRNICNDCVNIWLNKNIPYVYYTWVTRIYIKHFSFVQQFITYNTGLKLHIKCNSLKTEITWFHKYDYIWWWRHQMEISFALLAFCAGSSPVTGEFPAQRQVTRSSYVFLSVPEPTVGPTMEAPVIWDTIALIMTSL